MFWKNIFFHDIIDKIGQASWDSCIFALLQSVEFRLALTIDSVEVLIPKKSCKANPLIRDRILPKTASEAIEFPASKWDRDWPTRQRKRNKHSSDISKSNDLLPGMIMFIFILEFAPAFIWKGKRLNSNHLYYYVKMTEIPYVDVIVVLIVLIIVWKKKKSQFIIHF